MRHLICWIILLNFSYHCHKDNKPIFNFCKDIEKEKCVPPLENRKIIFRFNFSLASVETMDDLINKIYFAGDTLSFELQNYRAEEKLAQNNLIQVKYHFQDEDTLYPMGLIHTNDQSLTGFTNLGTILGHFFEKKKKERASKISPIQVHYVISENNKVFLKRSIIIQFHFDETF